MEAEIADFISEGFFEGDAKLPDDALGHDEFAQAMLRRVADAGPGIVFAIEGPWGHGKTDVLARMAASTYDRCPKLDSSGIAPRALWLNPWQYGDPNLLTPLVLAILKRIPDEPLKNPKVAAAAKCLLKVGLGFGLKAVALTMSAGQLWQAAAESVDELLASLAQDTAAAVPEPDPVAVAAEKFNDLCTAWLHSAINTDSGVRTVMICVDDLDRCLPDRQVALLESIRFISATGAPATFVIAIDPALARHSVLTHYHNAQFDPDRYLAKMFDLRTVLPALTDVDMERMVGALVAEPSRPGADAGPLAHLLEERLGPGARALSDAAGLVFQNTDLRNGRLVDRIIRRLRAWAEAYHGEQTMIGTSDDLRLVVAWLAVAEVWPTVRQVVQGAGTNFGIQFKRIQVMYLDRSNYGGGSWEEPNLCTLPKPNQHRDLTALFEKALQPPPNESADHVADYLGKVDRSLCDAGL